MLIEEILEATKGKLLCGDIKTEVLTTSTNSREIGEQCLFVPIIGENVDAHRFIQSAFDNGAVATFTSEHEKVDSDKAFIKVSDTIKALQDMGAYYGRKLAIPTVGITGSVGKTTTKEMVACALSAKYEVFKTSGNHNSQIGVPTTLLEMKKTDEYAVIEMGMSMPNEMKQLATLVDLDMAVITNIGVSHIEQLGTRQGICDEKMNIFNALKENGKVFLNGDDDILATYTGKNRKDAMSCVSDKVIQKDVIFYGTSEYCDYRGVNVVSSENGINFTLIHDNNEYEVKLNVLGKHNVLNALVSIAVAHNAGISIEDAINSLSTYGGVKMRQQIVKTNVATIIDDTYNASPDSMKAGLSVLCDYVTDGRKFAILADMLELGENSKKYHFEIGEYILNNPIYEVITFGEDAKEINEAIKNSKIISKHFDTREDITKYLIETLQKDDVVLLKGSRGMKLNEISDTLIEVFKPKDTSNNTLTTKEKLGKR